MIMPVMDGLTALKSIRQLYPQTKVLVATGYAAPGTARCDQNYWY